MLNAKKAALAGAVLAMVAGQAQAAASVVDWVQEAARRITQEIERREAEQAQATREEGVSVSRDQLNRVRNLDEREAKRDADVADSDRTWRDAGRQPRTSIRFNSIR